MTPMNSLRRPAARLFHDQRGSVALTFLLTSALMIGGTLGAIDLVRYNIAQSRLQNAVDAAGISAGQGLGAWDPAITSDKTAWQNYASAFFSANLPNHYQNSTITASNITTGIQYCTADSTGAVTCPSTAPAGTPVSAQYVNISVQGTMPLLSTGFLGRPSFTLLANNQVIRRLKDNTEIVMALEDSSYTGTNNGNIQAAAKSLVSAALGSMNANQTNAQGIRIGIVPFSAMVRMNPDSTTPNSRNWVKTVANQLGVGTYVQGSNHWLGCIAEPYPPNVGSYWGQNGNPALPAAKRTPPDPTNTSDPNSFQPVFMPIPATSKGSKSTLGVFVSSNNFTVTQLSSTGTLTGTTVSFKQTDTDPTKTPLVVPRAPNGGMVAPTDTIDYRFIGVDTSSNWGNVAPAVYSAFEPDSCAYLGKTQFLSQNTATLNAAINTMQGWQYSESLIAGGLLWSWRMVVPEWSSGTAGTGRGWDDTHTDLPADPANTDTSKAMVQNRAIVLVSTGMNSTASSSGYRAPQMYTGLPTQQSVFRMVVNYCSGSKPPVIDNTSGQITSCPTGSTMQAGAVTTPASTTITANSSIGNRGGVNNPKDTISEIGIWPATSLVNLDMRSPANIVNTFAGYGSKLVGQNTFSSFQDTTATIGWPAGTTSGMTSSNATAYMQAVCTAIKNDSSTYPIRIYTVFVGSSGSASQTDVANCASGPAYVFTNYNTNNLKSSFAAILGSMTELRLTK